MGLFRAILFVLSAIPLLTGLLDMLYGTGAIPLFGGTLPATALTEPSLDSQIRFLGAIWMGFGVLIVYAASDLHRHATLFRLIAVILIASGVGRIASLVQLGAPAPVFQGAIFVELVVVPLLLFWHARLIRSTTRYDSVK
jgi:hypothetical protein